LKVEKRKEYDAYLKQLENEKELPKGSILLKAEPGFCMKSSFHNKNDKKASKKLFINVCTSNEVKRPFLNTDSSTEGPSWRIPYLLGRMHLDQDKSQFQKYKKYQ